MKNKVMATIKKYNMLHGGEGVVIGLSGGADSVSLISVLSELAPIFNLRLYAVHLHHGIRGAEADEDEAFVAGLCKSLGIELFSYRRDIPAEAERLSLSVEEAGRKARYELFDEVMKKTGSSKIAVAHNMNDNTETVLMHLFRGTGIKGLGGIAPVRDNIIRPLIEVKRSEIEQYCKEKDLHYRTDSTNFEEEYTRNKVRLTLLPWLEENLNPSVSEALNKFSSLMREENDYLDSLAADAYKKCKLEGATLDTAELLSLDPVLRRRVVRLLFTEYVKGLKDISSEHIRQVCALAQKRSGSSINLPYELVARIEYGKLILEKNTDNACGYCYELKLNEELYIPETDSFAVICDKKKEIKGKIIYTNRFRCDIIKSKLTLRTRREGDKIYLNGIGGNKKLKKLFGELKISRAERDRIPLLALDSEILWAGGLKTSDKYRSENGNLYFYFWRNVDEGEYQCTDTRGEDN
jgi:tRNA(Ile)-lysidine synthase